jgi:hypothetical protein
MEFSIFVALMTSAISFAGEVLSAAISKVKDVASDHIFNKSFLEKTIADSTHKFEELLNSKSNEIKQEMKDQRVRECVEDVQARVASLRQLLGFTNIAEMNPQLAAQLIISALSPLHVSLEKARLGLRDSGKEDLWPYCQVVGMSALIAGYAYLGQDMPGLREELQKSIRQTQIRMLNSIANIMFQAHIEIPWERIPQLMSIEGVTELSELYMATARVWEHDRPENVENPIGTESYQQTATKILNMYTGHLSCSLCNSIVDRNVSSCPRCRAVFAN